MAFLKFFLQKSKTILTIMILGLAVLYFMNKLRWHYIPLYIFLVLYLILVILNYFELITVNPHTSRWILTIGIALLVGTIFLVFAFPTLKLPLPSGDFALGTKIYELEDTSRDEIYTNNKDDKRKIKYQIWYPSDDTSNNEKAKWINNGTLLTRPFARSVNAPYFIFDHIVKIDSNSYFNAPLSNNLSEYPIVIISHGWKSFREMHTDFAEELASHGFIVISIDHSYGAQAVKFDDGSIAYLYPGALPSVVLPETFVGYSKTLARTYGEDVRSVMDDLKRLNQDDNTFKNKLDLEAIGVLGHSTGGGGDVYAALKDNRIKALMGFDAWVEPLKNERLIKGLPIPSLFIRSEQWSDRVNNKSLDELETNSLDYTLLQMDGTRHTDFTMSYMLSPLTQFAGFSRMSQGISASKVQREMILKFFDHNLRDKDNQDPHYLDELVDLYGGLKFISPER